MGITFYSNWKSFKEFIFWDFRIVDVGDGQYMISAGFMGLGIVIVLNNPK